MPKINTYSMGNLQDRKLDPEKDVVIVIADTTNRKILEGKPLWKDVRTLQLFFDDIKLNELSGFEKFLTRIATTEKRTRQVEKKYSGSWPTVPMTRYHAKEIIYFAQSIGFEKNIHVCCQYGRSRSVAVGKFLGMFMFPGFEVNLSRTDCRVNDHVWTNLMWAMGHKI